MGNYKNNKLIPMPESSNPAKYSTLVSASSRLAYANFWKACSHNVSLSSKCYKTDLENLVIKHYKEKTMENDTFSVLYCEWFFMKI